MINKAGHTADVTILHKPGLTAPDLPSFQAYFQAGKGNIQNAKKEISFSVVHYRPVFVNFLPGIALRSCCV